MPKRLRRRPNEPIYGTAGGGVTLSRHGVLWAGDLLTSKARVKLALAVGAGFDRERLRELFN